MRKYSTGFTMVEMLAVIAVIAIIVALVIPNGIFARTTAEEATAKAQAATLEMAMGAYLARDGAAARTSYGNAIAGTSGTAALPTVFSLLQTAGALPDSATQAQFLSSFAGYNLTFPSTLEGSIVVRRADGTNAQIYP